MISLIDSHIGCTKDHLMTSAEDTGDRRVPVTKMKFEHLSRDERDRLICRVYEIGFTCADVGRAFGVSGHRIAQILDKHRIPRRNPCIPALVWFDPSGILKELVLKKHEN